MYVSDFERPCWYWNHGQICWNETDTLITTPRPPNQCCITRTRKGCSLPFLRIASHVDPYGNNIEMAERELNTSRLSFMRSQRMFWTITIELVSDWLTQLLSSPRNGNFDIKLYNLVPLLMGVRNRPRNIVQGNRGPSVHLFSWVEKNPTFFVIFKDSLEV